MTDHLLYLSTGGELGLQPLCNSSPEIPLIGRAFGEAAQVPKQTSMTLYISGSFEVLETCREYCFDWDHRIMSIQDRAAIGPHRSRELLGKKALDAI